MGEVTYIPETQETTYITGVGRATEEERQATP